MVAQYGFPRRDPETLIKSLELHCQLAQEAVERSLAGERVDLERYITCAYRTAEAYGEIRARPQFDFLDLGPSSPGVPYLKYATTKTEAHARFGEQLRELAMARLDAIGRLSLHEAFWYALNPVEKVRDGLSDPDRVFVKNEPHSVSKLKEGRVRVISSKSTVDILVQRYLYGSLVNEEIQAVYDTPGLPGMGFQHHDWLEVMRKVHRMERPCGIDGSAWDWTVLWWEQLVEAWFRSRRSSADPLFRHQMLVQSILDLGNVVYVDDGRIYSLGVLGKQDSGKLLTASQNSRIAVTEAMYVSGREAFAMGDDAVVDLPGITDDEVKRRYAQCGTKVKEVLPMDADRFVFCSHVWDESGQPRLEDPSHILVQVLCSNQVTEEQVHGWHSHVHGRGLEPWFWHFVLPRLPGHRRWAWEEWLLDTRAPLVPGPQKNAKETQETWESWEEDSESDAQTDQRVRWLHC